MNFTKTNRELFINAIANFGKFCKGNYQVATNSDCGTTRVWLFGHCVFTLHHKGGKWEASTCGWNSDSTVRCLKMCLEAVKSRLDVRIEEEELVLMDGHGRIGRGFGAFDNTYEWMTCEGAKVMCRKWMGEHKFGVFRKYVTTKGKHRTVFWKSYKGKRNAERVAAHFNEVAKLNAAEV